MPRKKPAAPAKPQAANPAPAVVKALTRADVFAAWLLEVGDTAAFTILTDYIAEGGHLPGFATDHGFSLPAVSQWIDRDPLKKAAYARVREERSHVYAEMILDVSRRDCTTPVLDADGHVVGTKVDPGAVAQAKLETDNLKWIAARLMQRVYGDKVDVNAKLDVAGLTDEELFRKLAGFGIAVQHRAAAQPEGGDVVH